MDGRIDCWMDHWVNVDESLEGLLNWLFGGLDSCGLDDYEIIG